uniref:Uncharacterized protein n=1 Tax=Cacopsylla melanoneura TaxID=428564 RepID=A0A8D8R590_9HEMI
MKMQFYPALVPSIITTRKSSQKVIFCNNLTFSQLSQNMTFWEEGQFFIGTYSYIGLFANILEKLLVSFLKPETLNRANNYRKTAFSRFYLCPYFHARRPNNQTP